MEKATIYMTTSTGEKIPVEVKLNKNLKTKKEDKKAKTKNNSKLRKALATTAVVLMIGTGVAKLAGCAVLNNEQENTKATSDTSVSQIQEDNTETKETILPVEEVKEELRFNPNSKESVIENAVFLIEEAARCGKELDAEDAVLAVIAANSNDLTLGFMGELFGESAEQTYTYNMITDAYLKTCLIQLETVGVTKSNDIAFNMENVFATNEDYDYLNNLRSLIFKFNNSTDENEKAQIITELNELAFNLTTYDNLDISSPAGVFAMLSLDGMRLVTNPMATPILPDDIRDEMFGNEGYSCEDEQMLLTAYSNRVSDLKLDNLKAKLSGAVLAEGKTPILNDIIMEVKEQTKDVQISDFDAMAEINKILNSYIREEYVYVPTETTPVATETVTEATTEATTETTVETTTESTTEKEDEAEETIATEAPTEKEEDVVIDVTIINPEVTTPTEPEIEIEENVTPEPGEEVIDTGDVEENKEEAVEQVEEDWQKAQEESNLGAADGMAYGLAGSPKPSFAGKSEYYINAFNASYDVYYQIYLDAKAQQEEFEKEAEEIENSITNETATESTTVETEVTTQSETEVVETTTETYDLDNLSVEELNALRDAALGTTENTNEEDKIYTK